MRSALAVTLLFMFVACASLPAPPITAFDSRPRYPVTIIPLSPSLILRHVARARSNSTYELVDADRTILVTASSTLTDPEQEVAEFRAYFRANDRITVFTSDSKNTILIVEDRSHAYPDTKHILLRRKSDSTWTWFQLDVPTIPRVGPPVDKIFPRVVGLSNRAIWFTAKGKTWSQRLNEVKPRA